MQTVKEILNIALVQAPLVWENRDANLDYFTDKIGELSTDVDLVLLPEMFTTGFTMNAKPNSETVEGKSVQWMQQTAQEKNLAISGSIIIEENGNFYNRLFFVFPSGDYKTYDKKHLFTLAGEEKVYSPGTKKVVVNYLGWKICPLVCYDLRFPVWSRNIEDYDLIYYVANWPKVRVAAWDALLKARAIENMAYCAGVNRVGEDGNGFPYNGHSAVYDALGNRLSENTVNNQQICVISLDKEKLTEVRKKFRFLADRDDFKIL